MRFTPQLLPSSSNSLGILLLNNAKALNALTLEMVHCTQDVLNEWLHHKDCPSGILIKSVTEGSKIPSFCAGGDVKAVCLSALAEEDTESVGQGKPGLLSADFFRDEYAVNHLLATLSTSSLAPFHNAQTPRYDKNPIVISFWDGLVMGGGVGLSIYGKYRVATERTLWAMPETGIGLFPDVGSLYWMPRLLSSHSLALYLALTGRRLKAPDLIHAGLATHYVPSDRLADLEAALAEASVNHDASNNNTNRNNSDPYGKVLDGFHQTTDPLPEESSLAQDLADIEKYFMPSHNVETILDNLGKETASEFAAKTHAQLLKMSPTSLGVTHLGLARGAAATSMAEDLAMEFRLGQACLRRRNRNDDGDSRPDFFEGIRAALVDKDHQPAWNPPTVEQVSASYIESFFAPIEFELDYPVAERRSTNSNSKL